MRPCVTGTQSPSPSWDGRAKRARIDHVLQLDPASRIINTNAGWIATMARDYASAGQLYKAALGMAPEFEAARSGLAIVCALHGRRDEALAELEKVSPDGENRNTYSIVYAMTGRRHEADRLARSLEELSQKEYIPASAMAPVWAALGDEDKAFSALRQVCQERDGAWGIALKVDPIYEGLRSDPRYAEVLDCLHLR